MLDESYVDEVVRVEEADTIRACHRLAGTGFLVRRLHGHSGQRCDGLVGSECGSQDLTAVAIAPDFGERYLDTVYQDQLGAWICTARTCSSSDELATVSQVRLTWCKKLSVP